MQDLGLLDEDSDKELGDTRIQKLSHEIQKTVPNLCKTLADEVAQFIDCEFPEREELAQIDEKDLLRDFTSGALRIGQRRAIAGKMKGTVLI